MDMIIRQLVKVIQQNQKEGFINIIYGPRRVGKTILLKQLTEKISSKDLFWFNGDTKEARNILSQTSLTYLTSLVTDKRIIVVDEAQRIPNIGLTLKILIDSFPEKTYFVSGSSSLMLGRGVNEPLTGRTVKYRLFPLSTTEMTYSIGKLEKPYMLEDQLIYGGYPYVCTLNNPKDKASYLTSVVEDYLFRDVYELEHLFVPDNLRKLATLLSYQIGFEVSFNELSRSLEIDVKTVSRYLNLLMESYVIFPVSSFSTNLRKEVMKAKKYYFWDLGIRNALTGQFLPLSVRKDTGCLWENFLAVERVKKHEYRRNLTKFYFWRSYEQSEIDWVETDQGKISAFEFKWQEKREHTPKAFFTKYRAKVQNIARNNYLDFIS